MMPKIAIAIATAGRREVLAQTLEYMARQTRQPDELLICPAQPEDLDLRGLQSYPAPSRVLHGAVGASAQRNVIVEASDADILVFFDDDFLPADDFLAECEALFVNHPEVVIATGKVLADGIAGPGLSTEEGMRLLAQAGPNDGPEELSETFNGYGCNMAVRMDLVRKHRVRFDEHLPMYSWLEDLDFSRQLAPHGDIVHASRLRGVHLGTKRSGRTSGRRLGYSQVANRIHIMRKGHITTKQAVMGSLQNIIANLVKTPFPEPWVDRRGRLTGNWLAICDWLGGRVDPRRIIQL